MDEEEPVGGPVGDEDEVEAGAPKWVVTFGDMMSLLLCFFVLLLSFSEMDVAKFKEVAGALEQAFGVQRETPTYERPKGMTVIFQLFDGRVMQQRLRDSLNALSRRHSRRDKKGNVRIEVFEDYRGLVLRVGEEGMFRPGQAKIKPFAFPLLDDIGLLAQGVDSEIEVEAHTDDRPISTKEFPSNWHLSAIRAVAVVDYLRRAGQVPGVRLKATGRGDAVPAVPNTTERGRAINRRVEFIFAQDAKTGEGAGIKDPDFPE